MNKFTERDFFELSSKVAQGKANEFEKSIIEASKSIDESYLHSFLNPGLIAASAIIGWWNKIEPDYRSKINSLTDRVNELENKLHESEIKYDTAMNIIKDLTNKDK